MLRELRSLAGLFITLVFAVVWANLASDSPDSTFHVAPMIVAGSGVVVNGSIGAGLTQHRVITTALGGLVAALATITILNAKNDLQGPTLWDDGGTSLLIEHTLFAGLGAVVGAIYALQIASRPPRDV
ncbi:MAG: hypothetical protein P8I99_13280 [Acidimicrobiales bacterium]|nr:hypothetical protein [Acidimicrobiales bacterium]MDG1878373.1 hypothetical protein [Acidimicrobiales bacterium]